jgi:hypothetical protein
MNTENKNNAMPETETELNAETLDELSNGKGDNDE